MRRPVFLPIITAPPRFDPSFEGSGGVILVIDTLRMSGNGPLHSPQLSARFLRLFGERLAILILKTAPNCRTTLESLGPAVRVCRTL